MLWNGLLYFTGILWRLKWKTSGILQSCTVWKALVNTVESTPRSIRTNTGVTHPHFEPLVNAELNSIFKYICLCIRILFFRKREAKNSTDLLVFILKWGEMWSKFNIIPRDFCCVVFSLFCTKCQAPKDSLLMGS